MECKQTQNPTQCSCSQEACHRKGICRECSGCHLKSRQLPVCCFPHDAERSYDRSLEHFARLAGKKKV